MDRIRLFFRKDKELYFSMKKILGFYPHDISLYQQALLHRSSGVKDDKGHRINNERLEFLGDAILGAIVGDVVYHHFEDKKEGFLTNTRSNLVKRETLGKIAVKIGLDKLIVSTDRKMSHNSYMNGNAFEALVGAIYLDRGYDMCTFFIRGRILKEIVNLEDVARKETNFKSKLLEWSQKNRINIEFKLLEQSVDKKDASPMFKTQVLVENIVCATASGYSKKESQQKAAEITLKKMKNDAKLVESIFSTKGQRTAMEEQPISIPNIEEQAANEGTTTPPRRQRAESGKRCPNRKPRTEATDRNAQTNVPREATDNDDFDFSDVSVKMRQLSKEDIVAAAEDEAFN
jgi:ribonuclease-3